jgi:hypothetical protein
MPRPASGNDQKRLKKPGQPSFALEKVREPSPRDKCGVEFSDLSSYPNHASQLANGALSVKVSHQLVAFNESLPCPLR